MMKAAVLVEFGQPLVIQDVDNPSPGPDEVLVKVMACGIDGTDLKLQEGFGYRPDLPDALAQDNVGALRPPPPKPNWPAICFIIFYICRNWFRSWLTSWGAVPLPRAMRRRRLPSMT